MSVIPEFLLKRLYKKGSLRETNEGIIFELKNILGPGVISGIDSIKINEASYEPDCVKFITQGLSFFGHQVSPDNPINFRLNQEGTLLLEGANGLKAGLNQIILSIISPHAGKVGLTLTDNI